MKKLTLILSTLTLIIACALVLVSCGGTDGGNSSCKVTLIVSDGVTVNGENPINVPKGSDAVFSLTLGDTYAFQSVSEGVYDPTTGTLTIKSVTRDTRVRFEAKDVGTDAKYEYHFYGTSYDSSNVANGTLPEGTKITVTAGDDKRAFLGWSFGGTIAAGGELISTSRVCTITLREIITVSGRCYIFPNYADSNVMYYKLNGGSVNTSSDNMTYSRYYTAEAVGDEVKVTLHREYFDPMGCASTFWDDGSFYREGYILKEYNTKPDGTGTGYSLGSKYPMEDGALYCIWEKASPEEDFSYVDINLPLPANVTASLAPHWVEDGVMITSYKGNDETVTIPEKLGGKYVVAIGKGAFLDCDMKTLVIGRRVTKIEDGAFVRCRNLTTFYYPDGIYYISNSAFDAATYEGFTSLYVNATISPRYSSAEGGCFATKFARLISSYEDNRVIVISGSSSYCGLSTSYLESLLEHEYTVINFGTTRTTHIYMYLEAMSAYTHEGDIILYAPENSIYEMGEPRLYWKSLRDLEGMYNIFRYVDISNYENVFGAFASFNSGVAADEDYDPPRTARYSKSYDRYENAINSGSFTITGEYLTSGMNSYCVDGTVYKNYYEITLNERFRSIKEGAFANNNPSEEDPYTSEKWCSALEARYLRNMNAAISSAKSSGAKVYFTFAPMDADALTAAAKANPESWFAAYKSFILDNYCFDGILGEVESYVFNHKYFFNNAYHTNNYGRAYRTYAMYLDLCGLLSIEADNDMGDVPAASDCLYEQGAERSPLTGVDYLK